MQLDTILGCGGQAVDFDFNVHPRFRLVGIDGGAHHETNESYGARNFVTIRLLCLELGHCCARHEQYPPEVQRGSLRSLLKLALTCGIVCWWPNQIAHKDASLLRHIRAAGRNQPRMLSNTLKPGNDVVRLHASFYDDDLSFVVREDATHTAQ
eukprot:COSAG02_NODE_7275_length_3088_cov_1.859485_3_plen_153_part_00